MRKNINVNNKILKYSIRKLSFGVAPIVVGALMFGSYLPRQEVSAADVNFKYVEKTELNENEKNLIKESIPKEYKNEDTYYLVYEKIVKDTSKTEILPNTGNNTLPIAGLGVGTAFLAVLLISKKHRNKVLSVVLIGALGQSVIVPYQTFALESKALVQYNKLTDVNGNIDLEKQVIDIPGYKYVGYFTSEDLKFEASEMKSLENKSQEKKDVKKSAQSQQQTHSTKPVVHPKIQVEKLTVKTEKKEVASKPVQPTNTIEQPKAKPVQPTQPVVQTGQEPKETVKPQKQIEKTQPAKTIEKPTYTEPVKVEQPQAKPEQPTVKPTPVQPTQPVQVEKPVVSTGGDEVKALVNEVPEYTLPLETKGTQEEGHEGEALVQPELPEYTGPVASSGGEEVKDLVHEVPEYTLPLETKGTQEEGHEGEALVQPSLPEYTGPVATKGTQEEGYEGEALVQPSLSEYTEALTTKGTQEEGHEGEALVQPTLPEFTGSAKLEPAVEDRPALDVVTKHRTEKENLPYEVEEILDPMLLKNRRRIEQQGHDGLRTIEYEDYLVNGKVEATKELSRTQVDPVKQIVKLGTLVKRKPTVEITNLTKDESKKSITVSYNLTDPTWAYVSAKAQIFDGDKLVKEVDIENTDKEQVIKGLDYYTPYTLKTKLTYNLGDFDEYSTETSTKNFDLNYKKLEIKDIDSVELYGKENGRYRRYLSLSEVPKDTTNYFAKVKSDRFKEMYLPVQSITENTDGNYKVTAAVDQLVEEGLEGYKDNYSFNVAKTKAEQDGVYTSFKNLVAAMQGNMAGVFKLGSDITADEIGLPNNKTSYLTGEFTGKLIGSDGTKSYAIYDLKKPLFETLNNATVSDLDLKNVDVDSRENAASLAKTANKATISNVSVEGKIAGRKSVAGLVVSASNTVIENSSFTGTIVANHANTAANYAGGIVGNISGSESVIDRAKVDAQISTAARNNNQNAGGIAGKVSGGALINNSVTYGKIINGQNYPRVGGIVGSTWRDGRINNVVSNMNVGYGYAITGDQYAGADIVNAVTAVNNEKDDKYATKLTKEQAEERVATYGITTTLEDTGEFLKTNIRTVDYTKLSKAQADRKVAYNNIEKLMPFYNKELVVNYGNKVDKTDKLYTTELLDVVPMNGNNVVTDINGAKNTINRLMLHYKDNTVAYLDVTFKGSFENNQVLEYNIAGKEYIFTPEAFVSDYTKIINNVLPALQGVTYNSETMKQVLGVTDNAAIDNLYLDREFEQVKANISEHLRKILAMDKSVNTMGNGVVEYVSEKIKNNKEALLLGLTYMNRWYNINYDDMNTKDLSTYKFDFNGNNATSTLDTLISLGNSELENLRGGNNMGLYGSLLAPLKGEDTVFDFVEAYRKLLLPNKTNNEWFKNNTKAYIVETKSDIPEVRKKQEEAAVDS